MELVRTMNEKIRQLSYIYRNYGTKLALAKFTTAISNSQERLTHYIPESPYTWQCRMVLQELSNRYESFIARWKKQHPIETADNSNSKRYAIWTCWLQGESTIPPFLHKIIDNQRYYLCDRPHHIITANNVEEYINIPGYIMDKFHDGIISPVHFTDIIRIFLLEQYGGIWCDATVLLTAPISKSIFDNPFYTIKGINMEFPASHKYPEIAKWEGYFIAGQQHALLYSWMKDFISKYWAKEERLIHYLLINQIALLGIKHHPVLQDEYASLTCSNQQCELLGPALLAHNKKLIRDVLTSDTHVFKLSRRAAYPPDLINPLLV